MNKERWLNKYSIEERFTIVTLMMMMVLFPVNMYFNERLIFQVVQIVLMFFCGVFLYFLLKGRYQKKIIISFCFLSLLSFTMLLPYSSGYEADMGYALQLVSTIILLLTVGRVKVLFSLLLILLIIYMPSELISYSETTRDPHIDYFIALIFLCVILFLFKRNLDLEEYKLRANNDKLEKLNGELKMQEDQLLTNKQHIEQMRNTLHADVLARTKQLEEKNKRLVELSFINAHLVRAPIANIIGIVNMKEDDKRLEELKKSILKMDDIIHKISNVLN